MTEDDVTRDAVAAALGRPQIFNAGISEGIEERFFERRSLFGEAVDRDAGGQRDVSDLHGRQSPNLGVVAGGRQRPTRLLQGGSELVGSRRADRDSRRRPRRRERSRLV